MIKAKADTTVIKATIIAESLGNAKTMNIVLFGALVKAMNLTDIDWEAEHVKEKTLASNIKAFGAEMSANMQ